MQYSSTKLLFCGVSLKVISRFVLKAQNMDGAGYMFVFLLYRNSYPAYYRVLLTQLVSCAKSVGTAKVNDPMESKEDKLIQWNMAVRIFHILVNLTKV